MGKFIFVNKLMFNIFNNLFILLFNSMLSNVLILVLIILLYKFWIINICWICKGVKFSVCKIVILFCFLFIIMVNVEIILNIVISIIKLSNIDIMCFFIVIVVNNVFWLVC